MPQLPELPKYYTVLVNCVEEAIELLESSHPEQVKAVLLKGLNDAEEIFMEMYL